MSPTADQLRAQGLIQISPSQVVTASRCLAKWGFEKILGYRDPDDMATALGSRVHEILEVYAKHGTPPSYDERWSFDPDWRRDGRQPTDAEIAAYKRSLDRQGRPRVLYPGRIALTMMGPHLPAPGVGSTEGEFVWADPRIPGTFWLGYKDWRGLEAGSGLRMILDHKTSADPVKWGKTAETLREDPQWLVYAEHERVMVPAPPAGTDIVGVWNYGARDASPRKAKVVRIQDLEDLICEKYESKIVPIGNLLRYHRQNRTDPNALLKNPNACSDFRGCPHRGVRCNVSDSDRLGAMIMTDQDPNAYVNSLLASIPGLGGAPAAAPAAAPAQPVASAPPAADPVAAAMAALGLPVANPAASAPNPPASATPAAPAMPAPHPQDNVSPPEAHVPSLPAGRAADVVADAIDAERRAERAAGVLTHGDAVAAVANPPAGQGATTGAPPEAHALPPSVVEAAGLSADALAASVAARQAAMNSAHAPLPGAVGGPPPTPPAQAAYKFTQQDLETLGRIIGEHVVARMVEALGAMR